MDNPLSSTEYGKIQRVLATIADGLQRCDKAEAAGISCDDLRPAYELTRQRAEQLKAQFFPDRP